MQHQLFAGMGRAQHLLMRVELIGWPWIEYQITLGQQRLVDQGIRNLCGLVNQFGVTPVRTLSQKLK